MLKRLVHLLLLIAALALLPANATPLLLDKQADSVDAWPAVTVMSDADGKLTPEQALAGRYTIPNTACATLRVHKDVMWLRVPLSVSTEGDGEWVLHVDYAV